MDLLISSKTLTNPRLECQYHIQFMTKTAGKLYPLGGLPSEQDLNPWTRGKGHYFLALL